MHTRSTGPRARNNARQKQYESLLFLPYFGPDAKNFPLKHTEARPIAKRPRFGWASGKEGAAIEKWRETARRIETHPI